MSIKYSDSGFLDGADETKKLSFDVSGVTTGTTRTITMPDGDTKLYTGDGTSGQVLTSGGAGVAPTFQAAAGGKVLQVVSGKSTSSTAVSGTYPGNIPHADTGLSLAITPTESDSDILILVVQSAKYDTGSQMFDISVHRDSTALNNYSGNGVGFGPIVNSLNVGTVQRGQQSLQYFDTGRSAGTSAITYKTRGGPYRTGTVTFQGENFQSTMILMEISV